MSMKIFPIEIENLSIDTFSKIFDNFTMLRFGELIGPNHLEIYIQFFDHEISTEKENYTEISNKHYEIFLKCISDIKEAHPEYCYLEVECPVHEGRKFYYFYNFKRILRFQNVDYSIVEHASTLALKEKDPSGNRLALSQSHIINGKECRISLECTFKDYKNKRLDIKFNENSEEFLSKLPQEFLIEYFRFLKNQKEQMINLTNNYNRKVNAFSDELKLLYEVLE